MEINGNVWIRRYEAAGEFHEPIAIAGAPGLRSVGKLAVDNLIEQSKAQPFADLYSTHLPTIYQTRPSYAAHPSMPGMGGVIVESGDVDLPKVRFYACSNPQLILVRGYHPNFEGQYEVAENVLDLLIESGVRRMFVVAGFGSKEKKVFCAASNEKAIGEMQQKFGIGIGYKGPFVGFSGLVFGLAKLKGIEAICLFSGTTPKEDDLEYPDKEASDRVVLQLDEILGLKTS